MARAGADDAAQLDRALTRRPGAVPGRTRPRAGQCRRAHRGVHDADRYDLRRHGGAAGPRASAGRPPRRVERRPGGVPRAARRLPGARSHRADDRPDREGRVRHGPPRPESVQGRIGANLDRQLRAGRVRHGGDHGGAGARSARLRVRAQVRSAGRGCRAAGRRAAAARRCAGSGRRGARRPGQFRTVQRPAERRGDPRHDAGGGRARHRTRRGPVPVARLGHLAAAVLGHAHPDHLLRGMRYAAGAGRGLAGRAARRRAVHGARRVTTRRGARVRGDDLSRLRRSGPARDGHHGHVRRLVVVLLPLLRPAQ